MARLKVGVRSVNSLTQLASVFAIAGGAGLCSYGRHIDPPLNANAPAALVSSVSQNTREVAAAVGGWGTGFITLGSLGLVIPWINSYIRHQALQSQPPAA
jgi:hypothetical protein